MNQGWPGFHIWPNELGQIEFAQHDGSWAAVRYANLVPSGQRAAAPETGSAAAGAARSNPGIGVLFGGFGRKIAWRLLVYLVVFSHLPGTPIYFLQQDTYESGRGFPSFFKNAVGCPAPGRAGAKLWQARNKLWCATYFRGPMSVLLPFIALSP